jgi:hypothetical protein
MRFAAKAQDLGEAVVARQGEGLLRLFVDCCSTQFGKLLPSYKLGERTVPRRDGQPWILAYVKDHARRRLERGAVRVVYEFVSHLACDGHRSRAHATSDYTRNVFEPNITCIMQGCSVGHVHAWH